MTRTGTLRRLPPPRCLLVATILTVAAGCDKTSAALPLLSGGAAREAADAEPPASAQLDISGHPEILFEVFGARDDARMIPIAALGVAPAGGDSTAKAAAGLTPIVLSSAKWHTFDAYYARAGNKLTAYKDGRPIGDIAVQRGMWSGSAPLYSLPGCRRLTPLASVTPPADPAGDYTVEYLASTSATLGRAGSERGAVPAMTKADAERIGRRVGESVAKSKFISHDVLDGLDFGALAVPTGATKQPTVVAWYVAPPALHSDSKSDARVAHVFALADARPDGYAVTFSHGVNAAPDAAEYRRYLDHLDVDGDGVDEIVLQGWRPAGDTFLEILAFRGGAWTPVFRGRESWCLDERAR